MFPVSVKGGHGSAGGGLQACGAVGVGGRGWASSSVKAPRPGPAPRPVVIPAAFNGRMSGQAGTPRLQRWGRKASHRGAVSLLLRACAFAGRKRRLGRSRGRPHLCRALDCLCLCPCLCRCRLVLALALAFASDVRAVKRAEHRRAAGPESSPCPSAASLGCVPRRPRSAGARRGSIAADRVRRRDFLVPFWSLKKELARASGRKPCTCSAFALFTGTAWVQILREEQSFRAVRAAYFCLVKSKQNRHRRTLADAMKPHRSPALLA